MKLCIYWFVSMKRLQITLANVYETDTRTVEITVVNLRFLSHEQLTHNMFFIDRSLGFNVTTSGARTKYSTRTVNTKLVNTHSTPLAYLTSASGMEIKFKRSTYDSSYLIVLPS